MVGAVLTKAVCFNSYVDGKIVEDAIGLVRKAAVLN